MSRTDPSCTNHLLHTHNQLDALHNSHSQSISLINRGEIILCKLSSWDFEMEKPFSNRFFLRFKTASRALISTNVCVFDRGWRLGNVGARSVPVLFLGPKGPYATIMRGMELARGSHFGFTLHKDMNRGQFGSPSLGWSPFVGQFYRTPTLFRWVIELE